MKKMTKKIFSLFIAVMMVCSLFTIASKKTYADDTYDAVINNMEVLEGYCNDYVTDKSYSGNAVDLVLMYLRTAKYTSSQWNLLGGTIPSDLVTYIADKDTANSTQVASLRSVGDLTLPDGSTTDFIHMMAAMNLCKSSFGDVGTLGGWGGDLVTFLAETKSATDTLDVLTKKDYDAIGKTSGSFGSADMIADLDAPNIIALKNANSSKTFAEVMDDYYKNVTTKSRATDFIKNALKTTTTDDQTAIFDAIKTQYTSCKITIIFFSVDLINQLEQSEGVSGTDFDTQRQGAQQSFANYLYHAANSPYDVTGVIAPTTTEITYGESLSDSTLSNGKVTYTDPLSFAATEVTVPGTFTFKDGTIKPSVSDSDVTTYEVTFTPDDTTTYKATTANVTVKVNKADPVYETPLGEVDQGAKLSDIVLPEGFTMESTDDSILSTPGTVTVKVTYTPTDTVNYNTLTGIEMLITVKAKIPVVIPPVIVDDNNGIKEPIASDGTVNTITTGDNTDTTPFLIVGGVALIAIVAYFILVLIKRKKH